MCFTPWISFSTFLIEYLVAFFILFKYKNSRLKWFFFTFLLVLGFYQFTEFMLCTTNSAVLWSRIGFITYTFLPAIGLYFIPKIFGKGKYKNSFH